jgi:hypothetical protein
VVRNWLKEGENMGEKLVFEVEISEEALKKFWDKLQKIEITKGTIDEAEDYEVEDAFKEFFYQDLGLYSHIDLRDEVTIKLKSRTTK